MMEEQKIKTEPGESKVSTPGISREPFFGMLLFGSLILLVTGALGLLGWGVYRGWHVSQEESALPSIATLQVGDVVKPEESSEKAVDQGATPPQAVTAEEGAQKAKATNVKVMNGGAAKGSATTVAESLKQAGFTKIATGNTTGNYTGIVVYFAPGLDTEAAVLKNVLLKSYPKAEAKPAPKDNKEASLAPLTVILGK